MQNDENAIPPPVVHQGQALGGQAFEFLNGAFHLKVSGKDSFGAACIYDTLRSEPGGPPLHVHAAQDEWFYVTEGAFDIRVGDTVHHLGPGDSVLGPRGVPHAFRNTSQTGRIVVAFFPAGSMESFFHEGSALSPLTPASFAELSQRHGMTVVGPPLG